MSLLKITKLFGVSRKSVLLSAIIVLVSLVFTVFAVTTNLDAANAGDTVVIVNTAGGADLFDIATSTQILELGGCPLISPTYDPAKDIACAAGHMRAQELYEKISDIWTSLNSINHRIGRLNQTINYIKTGGFSATNLNGLSLYAVPAGDLSKDAPHIKASSISMKCLITSPTSSIMGPSSVGTQVNYNNKVFNPLPIEALKALLAMIDDNEKSKKIVNSGLTEIVFGIDTGIPDRGKIRALLALGYKDQLLTAQHFIPVIDLDTEESNYSAVSFSNILDDGGNKQTRKFRKIIKKIGGIETVWPGFPDSGTWMSVGGGILLNAKIGNVFYAYLSSEIGYKSPIPESFIFNMLNKSIEEHMKEYQRLKLELETESQAIQVERDALVANNFNCNP